MQIAQVFAGFSLGKPICFVGQCLKDANEMSKMSEQFMEGSRQLGRDPQVAKRLFSMITKFAGYGFNKSHAYAYSSLSLPISLF